MYQQNQISFMLVTILLASVNTSDQYRNQLNEHYPLPILDINKFINTNHGTLSSSSNTPHMSPSTVMRDSIVLFSKDSVFPLNDLSRSPRTLQPDYVMTLTETHLSEPLIPNPSINVIRMRQPLTILISFSGKRAEVMYQLLSVQDIQALMSIDRWANHTLGCSESAKILAISNTQYLKLIQMAYRYGYPTSNYIELVKHISSNLSLSCSISLDRLNSSLVLLRHIDESTIFLLSAIEGALRDAPLVHIESESNPASCFTFGVIPACKASVCSQALRFIDELNTLILDDSLQGKILNYPTITHDDLPDGHIVIGGSRARDLIQSSYYVQEEGLITKILIRLTNQITDSIQTIVLMKKRSNIGVWYGHDRDTLVLFSGEIGSHVAPNSEVSFNRLSDALQYFSGPVNELLSIWSRKTSLPWNRST